MLRLEWEELGNALVSQLPNNFVVFVLAALNHSLGDLEPLVLAFSILFEFTVNHSVPIFVVVGNVLISKPVNSLSIFNSFSVLAVEEISVRVKITTVAVTLVIVPIAFVHASVRVVAAPIARGESLVETAVVAVLVVLARLVSPNVLSASVLDSNNNFSFALVIALSPLSIVNIAVLIVVLASFNALALVVLAEVPVALTTNIPA